MPPYHVAYLTGAPSSGKSTVSRRLQEKVSPLAVWDYGERLRRHVEQRAGTAVSYDEVRGASARIITADDVRQVDRQLIEWVQSNRSSSHLLVDTHAVTKEDFGFRATPFSLDEIRALSPTKIFVLYVPPEVTLERIARDPAGRSTVTHFEAGFHAGLQAAVAITYAAAVGIPAYFVDSSVDIDSVVEQLVGRLTG